MLALKLQRFAQTPDGVLGRLGHYCTLEEEWHDNQRNVSCIPAGLYRCERQFYNKGGYWTFEVTGVPDRSKILFHIGNTEEDTAGCILLGMRFGALVVRDEDSGIRVPKVAVMESQIAFASFMQQLKGVNEFLLRVLDYDMKGWGSWH